MRICFDPQIFALQDYGGISRYFVETAARLAEMPDTNVAVLAFVHINAYLAAAPRLTVVGRSIPAVPGPVRRMLVRADQQLARAWIRRHGADIVHETYYSAVRTAPAGRPTVLTVFDMIHEKFPDYAPRTRRIAEAKRAAIGRADHVICISENTRRDLEELYGTDRSRTSVVRLGFALESPVSESLTPPIQRPYILFVGKRDGYKDFSTLLRAYAGSPSIARGFMLACFGDTSFTAGERRLMGELGLGADRVIHGRGSDRLLAAYYRHASLFVYPSRYEGFGMPPLEAMSQDCPVVCSNAASLPEVVGDAAVTFEAGQADALRTAMESVLGSSQMAASLRQRGRLRAREFSWEICAKQTRAVYASLL